MKDVEDECSEDVDGWREGRRRTCGATTKGGAGTGGRGRRDERSKDEGWVARDEGRMRGEEERTGREGKRSEKEATRRAEARTRRGHQGMGVVAAEGSRHGPGPNRVYLEHGNWIYAEANMHTSESWAEATHTCTPNPAHYYHRGGECRVKPR